ncbi:hypothetical protein B0H19DRAFT_1269480 [Mycena capillaripes]|nr:hypothetical protein B0H19DRAFT_1269480 [Mycena capillaripes]
MAFVLCPNSEPNPFALNDACIRASWCALLPAALVFLRCIAFIPIRIPAFQEFLTLKEAEALSGVSLPENVGSPPRHKGMTAVLVSLALVEILLCTAVGIFEIVFGTLGTGRILPFLFATSWLYAFFRPLIKNSVIPVPMDLFWLFFLEFAGAISLLGGVLLGYDQATKIMVIVFVGNVIITASLLAVVLRLPLGVRIRESLDGAPEPTPEDYTSLFSWITFAWVYPLIRRGTKNTLTETDVWNLSPTMQARPVFHKFTSMKRTSLLRSLWFANSLDLARDGCLSILSALLGFAGPFFMNLILSTLEKPLDGGRRLAYLYAFLAFACQIAKAESDVLHFYYGRRASTRIQTELMVAVYDKALKRCDFTGIVDADAEAEAKAAKDTKTAKNGKTGSERTDGKQEEKDFGPKAGAQLGKIVNLMSVDANTVASLPAQIFFFFYTDSPGGFIPIPVRVPLISNPTGLTGIISSLLGSAAFSGILIVFLSLPINWLVAKLTVKYEKGIVTARDKRTSVVSELISSIKFIKFGGAEERWLKKANDARDIELSWLLKSRFAEIALHITWYSTFIHGRLSSISSFFVYIKQGNELTVATAFTALAVFNMLNTPLSAMPFAISFTLQASVVSWTQALKLTYEVPDQVSALKATSDEENASPTSGLVIKNGYFKWNELAKDEKAIPSELEIPDEAHFELRDISISFPEGKLTCVVGPTASGKTALLLALLGEMTCLPGTQITPPKNSRVDENGNMHCISYAAQTPWLQYASIKDNITFGFPFDAERYNAVLEACALLPDIAILPDGDRTEIGVLLDDPLSAVDSHTAWILCDKLFCGPLLRNRTVVLVTHHLDLLLSAPEGLGAHYIVRVLDGRISEQGTVQDLRARGLLDAIKQQESEHDSAAGATEIEEQGISAETKPAASQPIAKLVEDEEQAKGDVQWRIYKTYLEASGVHIWIIILMVIILIEILYLGQKLWIKACLNYDTIWGEAYQTPSGSLYLISLLSQGVPETLRLPSVPSPTSRTAPFDFPPARDHPMFYVGIYTLIGLAITLVNASLVGLQYYSGFRASRLLFRKLLNTIIYSTFRWFDATPKGRILNRTGKDVSTIDNRLSHSLYNFTHSMAGLIVTLLTVGIIFPVFFVPGSLLFFAFYKLTVAYLHSSRDLRRMEANTRSPIYTGFSELLEGIVTVRAFGVEKRFLDEMMEKVNLTTRLGYSNNDLLVVEDLEVKYAPSLPSVLHRINFSLKPRERVGLLGRTGSGKSTLATSLLRFVEPTNGRIIVDGIDISTLGLHDLRTRLTFIPQDATLFSGTVRDNLDPFGEYEDVDCEAALYRVHLLSRSAHQLQRTSATGTPVDELEGERTTISGVSSATEVDPKPVISVDSLVSAEGSNWSAGQRQLLALARALLRQSSIIILDEATSSIDFETDQKIQTTIREEFNQSLLLTVAHRIKTVIDYDRLIILDQGKIAQFDTPYNLIRSEGIFREMCKKTGAFAELEAAARPRK